MSLTNLPWQVLLLIGVLFNGLASLLNKYQSHRGSALQVQTCKYIGSFSWMLVWWLAMSRNISTDWWKYIAYGMVIGVNVVLYTKAQRISMSQTSLVEPVGQLLGIFLAAVLLREWTLFAGQSGIYLIFALLLMPLVFWLFYEYQTVHSRKWLKLVSAMLVLLAFFKVITKHFLNSAEAIDILVFQYIGSFLAVSGGVLLKNQHRLIKKKFALRGFVQGLIGSSSGLMLYMGVKAATVTQTTLFRTPLVIVIKTMVGLLVFREIAKMTKKKWLGVVVALIIMLLVMVAGS